MKQMNPDQLETVEVDLMWSKLPKSFYVLKPAVYKDGDAFCCLFGRDPQQGIFGCGDNAEEAIQDWVCHLHELLYDRKNNSEVVEYIRTRLSDLESDAGNSLKVNFNQHM